MVHPLVPTLVGAWPVAAHGSSSGEVQVETAGDDF